MLRLIVAIAVIPLLVLIASAHYGAKFEPPDGRIYHGSGWDYNGSQSIYENMFPGDRRPLILQVNVSIPGTRGTDVARTIAALTRPIVHEDSQFVEYSMHWQGRDAAMMLDSIYVFTDLWDGYVDTLEAAFRQVNRPFFFRIGFEFNGDWNPYHPYIYPKAFRKLVLELRSRGIDNFATVWCYEPDADASFADSTRQGWKWYPGDDVVDWFGLDLFQVEHFNPAAPDSQRGQLSHKGKSEAFLRFAEARGKPVYLNEFSAIHIEASPDSLDPNGEDGARDWEAFFVPFYQFIDNHPNIKGWNYINVNWNVVGHYGEQGWRDARLEINRVLRENWVRKMTEERFINAGYDIAQHQDGVNETDGGSVGIADFRLMNAYPNPFNSSITVVFPLVSRLMEPVDIGVYDLSGRLVERMSNVRCDADGFRMVWTPVGTAPGVYWLKLRAGEYSQTIKATLVK